MVEEKNLPKPQTDLPLPEKELMPHKNRMNSKIFFVIFVMFSTIIGFLAGGLILGKNNLNNQAACTQEAKLCPDGSYVGREGPNCEFTKCPTSPASTRSKITPTTTVQRENWETYKNTVDNWQIDYPTNENFKITPHEAAQIGPNGTGEPVVFAKLGPTQTEGTEFHDGISISIGVLKKDESLSLKDFADSQTKPDENIGSTRTPLKEVEINGAKGIETTVSSLGTFRQIFLEYPVLNNKVYFISIFADGPEKSANQYKIISEEMLNSFKPLQ